MNPATPDLAQEILCELIALNSVNPMGRAYSGSLPVERPVVEYLERQFAPFDLEMRRTACGPIHESLLIEIPGETDLPGTLLESHADTVPADDWFERAFAPRLSEGRVYGRGACDDKGSLAAMVVAALHLLKSQRRPKQTVWILIAADEEHAQSGIKSFLDDEPPSLGRAIFGEPTDLVPVIQHKGTLRWDIVVRGQSAHTSHAELGRNAIVDMSRVVQRLAEYEQRLQSRHSSPLMSGPSLTVTMIQGGRTRNMVPDRCSAAIDFRVLPDMDMQRSFDDVTTYLRAFEPTLEHSDFQCFAPALNTAPSDPFVQQVLGFCRTVLGREVFPAGVSYGSDAAWTPDGVSAIVLGPGNIAQAHAVDEYVELQQVIQASSIYQQVLLHDWR